MTTSTENFTHSSFCRPMLAKCQAKRSISGGILHIRPDVCCSILAELKDNAGREAAQRHHGRSSWPLGAFPATTGRSKAEICLRALHSLSMTVFLAARLSALGVLIS